MEEAHGRRQRAQIPRDVAFQTKTELARDMIGGHAAAGVPFAWVAGDEVYGRTSKLRGACQQAGKGCVFAVPSSFQIRLPSGRKIPVAALARLIPAAARETRSCGPGCKGHRDYHWAWAATWSPGHWALLRRSRPDPSDLAFFYCHAPAGRSVSLPALIMISGRRWPAEVGHCW